MPYVCIQEIQLEAKFAQPLTKEYALIPLRRGFGDPPERSIDNDSAAFSHLALAASAGGRAPYGVPLLSALPLPFVMQLALPPTEEQKFMSAYAYGLGPSLLPLWYLACVNTWKVHTHTQ